LKVVHVLQHTAAEYLGLIEDHLEGRGVRFRYLRPFAGQTALPPVDVLSDAGLVLLGGGDWGSAGTRDLPTLAAEIELTRHCIDRGYPVVGIGLGAQILAIAAGGHSEPAPLCFELDQAERIQDDALGGHLPEHYPLPLFFMRDWPVSPAEARILAVDRKGRPAFWQVGARAFGLTAHPGLKVAMIEDLVMECEESPREIAAGLAALRLAQRDIEDALVRIMTGLVAMTGWMD